MKCARWGGESGGSGGGCGGGKDGSNNQFVDSFSDDDQEEVAACLQMRECNRSEGHGAEEVVRVDESRVYLGHRRRRSEGRDGRELEECPENFLRVLCGFHTVLWGPMKRMDTTMTEEWVMKVVTTLKLGLRLKLSLEDSKDLGCVHCYLYTILQSSVCCDATTSYKTTTTATETTTS